MSARDGGGSDARDAGGGSDARDPGGAGMLAREGAGGGIEPVLASGAGATWSMRSA